MAHQIDLSGALTTLERAAERMAQLNTVEGFDPERGRDSSASNARISRELLFIAHLCKKTEALVLDEYHSFKGETDHIL